MFELERKTVANFRMMLKTTPLFSKESLVRERGGEEEDEKGGEGWGGEEAREKG